MLVYPSGIDLSSRALQHLSGLLAGHRRQIGSRWRRLTCGRQALLVLAHLRCGGTYARLAAGFRVGIATVHRYIREAVDLLAARAPTLDQAMMAVRKKAYVILDGTVLPIDRIAAGRPFYSGKHRKHGMNVQVITDPAGRLLWASPALPGAVHDVRAARTHGIIGALTEAGVRCWADKAYRGVGGTTRVPYWGRRCPQASKPSTAHMRKSAHSSNRPWPPSRPGDSCASCDAPPPASPPSSRPSSPSIRPAQTQDEIASVPVFHH